MKTVAHNSSGNAGGSWSLYAARAGITCVNLLPTDVQPSSLQHCRASGQPAFLVENWHEAGRMVAEACERNGWLNICTLREPYRLEGKKTMGLEIAEQLGWKMPTAIFYPMGGGLGAIAIYKAFEELLRLGWIAGSCRAFTSPSSKAAHRWSKPSMKARMRARRGARSTFRPAACARPILRVAVPCLH